MKAILTILDDITETSMPFNEFALYRANHFKNEQHVLIICSKSKKIPKVKIPTNMNIIYVGKNILRIRKNIMLLIKKYRKENIEYLAHLHQVKSGFLVQISMLGTGFRKKTLFTVHSTFSGYSIHNKILSFINLLFSNRATCVSKYSYENYPKIIRKIKREKFQAIQNGVDTERIDKVSIYKESKDNKYVNFIYVARIIPIKNHIFLINVLKNAKSNIKFIFVGNDRYANNLKELCKKYNLEDRVEFTGLIPRDEVFRKVKESDVYISSSLLEGMPVSVLEAAYCRLPIIISDIPQHSELANNNDFISLLPFNIENWVDTVNRYASITEKERTYIGMQCKKYIEKNFSLKNMHEKYEEIYKCYYNRLGGNLMLNTIKKLFEEFDEHNIRYCHWKSNEHLDAALVGDTDLDILVDFSQRLEFEQVLVRCGLKRFRSTPLMQYNGIEDFIGFDQEEAKIWHLHTHYRMTLGEKHLKGYTITPWTKHILDNRVRTAEGVYTSMPEDELVLILCRIALKIRMRDYVRKIGKGELKEIEWLLNNINKEVFYQSVKQLTNESSAKAIVKIVNSKIRMKNQFIELQRCLRKELKPYTSFSTISSYLTRTRREIFWLCGGIKRRLGLNNYVANRRVAIPGGLAVAILGCDGAGKSTTLSYVKKEFSKKIDVVEIYFGSGDGKSSLIRKPMKIIAKKVAGKGVGHKVEKEYRENKKVSLKSKIYSIAKIVWAITLAKEKKKRIRQMTKARNNGLLVLTDRYPQSTYPGCSDGPLLSRYGDKKGLLKKLSEWELHIYEMAAINPPDLTIKLMVQTEIAIERKPEMTKEEIEQKKKIVKDIKISERSVDIDTSRDFKITRGEVMSEIWKII